MRRVIAGLGFEPELGKFFFQARNHLNQVAAGVFDADEQSARFLGIREPAGSGKTQFKGFELVSDVPNRVADRGDFDVVDVAQKLEG